MNELAAVLAALAIAALCPLIVAVGYAAAGVTLCAGAVLVGIALVALGALADRRAP